jgi:hypothetical protein
VVLAVAGDCHTRPVAAGLLAVTTWHGRRAGARYDCWARVVHVQDGTPLDATPVVCYSANRPRQGGRGTTGAGIVVFQARNIGELCLCTAGQGCQAKQQTGLIRRAVWPGVPSRSARKGGPGPKECSSWCSRRASRRTTGRHARQHNHRTPAVRADLDKGSHRRSTGDPSPCGERETRSDTGREIQIRGPEGHRRQITVQGVEGSRIIS